MGGVHFELREGVLWERPLGRPGAAASRSLMTPLGLVSGDVLTHLEAHGATSLRGLIRHIGWSAPLVTMAVGALVRSGHVRAVQHDLEIIVEPITPVSTPGSTERWGGA